MTGTGYAAATMRIRELEHSNAVDDLGLDRHEMLGIDLARRLEQDAGLVAPLAVLAMRCPGGVAGCDIKLGGVLGLLVTGLMSWAIWQGAVAIF